MVDLVALGAMLALDACTQDTVQSGHEDLAHVRSIFVVTFADVRPLDVERPKQKPWGVGADEAVFPA